MKVLFSIGFEEDDCHGQDYHGEIHVDEDATEHEICAAIREATTYVSYTIADEDDDSSDIMDSDPYEGW